MTDKRGVMAIEVAVSDHTHARGVYEGAEMSVVGKR